MKCIICDRRPARGGAYCVNCSQKLEAQNRRKNDGKPAKFLTYRGFVVGLFSNGNGMLTARLLKRKAESLPKKKTLNLNTYLEGYTRKQIKQFKACVLKLANA